MIVRLVTVHRMALLFVAVVAAAAVSVPVQPETQEKPSIPAKDVQIVLLGTGTPTPNPDRQGPSLAIVVNRKAYLVDAGTGIVRQSYGAFQRGMSALQPPALDIAFLTHLHSDHTLGLPDLILTPWVQERTKPLQLYGPPGTKAMADHLLQAYQEDILVRTSGNESGNRMGYKVEAHEVRPGTVYQDENVTVKAFQVKHAPWKGGCPADS